MPPSVAMILTLLAIVTSDLALSARLTEHTDSDPSKYRVPDDFLLGVGTSSYQTEGAWDEDGKGVNVFDYYYHRVGRNTSSDGDVAADSYHRYAEDIALAAEMKLNVYRISISWTRILPDGKLSSKNQKGIDHYHAVIDEIIKKGMTPMITMFHFDYPQSLQSEFGGWLSERMIEAFLDYADVLFSEYSQKVRHWVPINEPNMYCLLVYDGWGLPPSYQNSPLMSHASVYRCMHNQLLAHAAAYNLFQQKYNAENKGVLGIGAVSFFSRPNSTEYDDVEAARRANMFDLGMMVHPFVQGDYPPVVREAQKVFEIEQEEKIRPSVPHLPLRATLQSAGNEAYLPTFTEDQIKSMKGAADFVALNVYFGQTVADPKKRDKFGGHGLRGGWRDDTNVTLCTDAGASDQDAFGMSFTKVTEWVLRDALLFIKANFGPGMGIFITENGLGVRENSTDDWNTRAVYHSKYLREMFRTINEDNVKALGYTVWSFLDDYEFRVGYFTRRFGIVHVDYETGSLNRTLKASCALFKQIMEERVVPLVEPRSRSSSSQVSISCILSITAVSAIFRNL